MKVLVTGSTGFVGSALCESLQVSQHDIVRSTQRLNDLDWSSNLQNVDTVVHLAARVHVMQDKATDSLAEFRLVNVDGTVNLARQAAAVGVKRFIFLSSIHVNGAFSQPNNPFSAADKPLPHSDYATSKLEAEIALRQIALLTGMEVAIIRPPLIYGKNALGNFGALVNALNRGCPLPLSLVKNNFRSYVSLANLVDFITVCITHPNAANQTFLVSDNDDVSTADLLHKLGVALGAPAKLVPVPICVLKTIAYILNKNSIAEKLLGNLQVDITKNKELLNWQPIYNLEQSLNIAFNKE